MTGGGPPGGGPPGGGPPGPAGPPGGRLTLGQLFGWTVAFLLIALLVVLFFLYGDEVRPVLGALPGMSWQTS